MGGGKVTSTCNESLHDEAKRESLDQELSSTLIEFIFKIKNKKNLTGFGRVCKGTSNCKENLGLGRTENVQIAKNSIPLKAVSLIIKYSRKNSWQMIDLVNNDSKHNQYARGFEPGG